MTRAYVDEDGIYLFSFDGDVSGPPGSVEVSTAPDDARQVWDFVAGGWGPPPIDPPVSYINNEGLARFQGFPAVMLENNIMGSVSRISKGRYRAYHENAYPSDQYSVTPSVFDALPRSIRTTARTADFVEVRVTDNLGIAQDPAEVTIKTERVVTT